MKSDEILQCGPQTWNAQELILANYFFKTLHKRKQFVVKLNFFFLHVWRTISVYISFHEGDLENVNKGLNLACVPIKIG